MMVYDKFNPAKQEELDQLTGKLYYNILYNGEGQPQLAELRTLLRQYADNNDGVIQYFQDQCNRVYNIDNNPLMKCNELLIPFNKLPQSVNYVPKQKDYKNYMYLALAGIIAGYIILK